MASKKQLVDLDFSSASKILQLPAASASGHAVEYDQLNTALGLKQNNLSVASGNPFTISSDEIRLDLLSSDNTLTLSNLNTASLEVTLEREDEVFGTVSGNSGRTFSVNTSYNIYFYVQNGNPVIVAYNTTSSQWEVFKILGGDTPANWSAGALSGSVVGAEDLTSSSETINSKNSPASSDNQVAYSGVDSSYLVKSGSGLSVDIETTLAGASGKIADAAAVKTYVDEIDSNVDALISLSGVAEEATTLGTFSGSTISDNSNLKSALQELEVAAESNQLEVAANSSSLLSISGNEISVSSLLLTNVTVNTDATDLADYISNNSSEFSGLEEGDILILVAATDQTKRSFIHNGGSAGTSADMTRMQVDLNVDTIRAMLSGTSGQLDYNATTGVFSFNASAAENIAPTAHSFTAVSSPSSLQDFMEKADVLLAGLASGSGFSAGAVDTAAIADDAIEADALSSSCVTSAAIASNAVTSAAVADDAITTDAVADGSITLAKMAANSIDSAQYIDESIDTAHLSDGVVTHAKLGADCVDGDNLQDDAVESEHIAAAAVDFAHLNGAAICSDFSSAGANQVARADKVKEYIDGRSYMRMSSEDVDLVADTDLTITHSLGNKYVTCQVYDSADKLMDVEVTLLTANTLKLKATINASDSKVIIVG